MRRHLSVWLCAAVFLFGVATNRTGIANANADPAVLHQASVFAGICQHHMPDTDAAAGAFFSAGFLSEGSGGSAGFLDSMNGRRILADTSKPSSNPQYCAVVVRQITVAQDLQLAQPGLSVAKATRAEPPNQHVVRAWNRTFRGAPITIAARKPIRYGWTTGAANYAFAR